MRDLDYYAVEVQVALQSPLGFAGYDWRPVSSHVTLDSARTDATRRGVTRITCVKRNSDGTATRVVAEASR